MFAGLRYRRSSAPSLSAPKSRYHGPQSAKALLTRLGQDTGCVLSCTKSPKHRTGQRRRSPTRGQRWLAATRVGGSAVSHRIRGGDGRTDGWTPGAVRRCRDVLLFFFFLSAVPPPRLVFPPALPDGREWLAEGASLSGDNNLVTSILARQGPATHSASELEQQKGYICDLDGGRILWLPPVAEAKGKKMLEQEKPLQRSI
jgi:hypothetical protein